MYFVSTMGDNQHL